MELALYLWHAAIYVGTVTTVWSILQIHSHIWISMLYYDENSITRQMLPVSASDIMHMSHAINQ